MKIAFVIERMDVSRGGRETSTAQVAEELARRGHEVHVICQRGSWRGEGVTVRSLGTRGALRITRLRNFIHDANAAAREGGYDIVHATLPLPGANVYQPRGGTIPAQIEAVQRRRGMLGGSFVLLLGPLNFCREELGRLERALVADSGVLCLAVSQMVAGEFERHYGRTGGVQVVFNGVDMPAASDAQRAQWRDKLRDGLRAGPQETVFITVATNFALKAVDRAIVAFAKWYHSSGRGHGGKLVVIGKEHPENYHRHASLRDVGRQVIFIPPSSDIFQWYSAADAVVLLSWYDPCSRVVLEATRWSVPSITTSFNGAAEALANGAGIVVPSPRDTGAIVAAMEELSDPQRRERRAAACREASAALSVERHVDGLLQAYASIVRA